MDRLPTRVNRVDPDYQNRRTHNLELIETLRSRLDAVSEGGGGKYVERHRSRGKMLARERIQKIIDPGTAFLELSPLAAYELYDLTGDTGSDFDFDGTWQPTSTKGYPARSPAGWG